jgi:hypothetical protein
MHRWVTSKEVKAVLVRVVRDCEGNLVSVPRQYLAQGLSEVGYD